jgi:hypothetical protein
MVVSLLAPASAERHNHKSPDNDEKGRHPWGMIHEKGWIAMHIEAWTAGEGEN